MARQRGKVLSGSGDDAVTAPLRRSEHVEKVKHDDDRDRDPDDPRQNAAHWLSFHAKSRLVAGSVRRQTGG
jgi:hypothetical protein